MAETNSKLFTSFLKLAGIVASSWLILTVALYGLSAVLNQDSLVFLTGGSTNLSLVFFINFVVLATAWGTPIMFRMHSDVVAVKGRAPLFVIIEIALLLIMLVGFYLVMNRILLGFLPTGIDIQLTPDFQQAFVTRMAVFVGATGFGTLLGLAILFPRIFREPKITVVDPSELEGR
jgi:hypothetical protein